MTVLMPWLVIPALPPKDPKGAALARLGPTGPMVVPVVKFHGFGTRPEASALPTRSFAALETVAVYCVLAVRLALGVNVAILVCESYVTVPVTAAPFTPATARVNVPGAVIVSGSIDLLNSVLTVLFKATAVATFAGLVSVIVGAVEFGPVPVVKFHGLGTAPAASAFPLRSFAAVVIFAVNCVLAVRLAD